MTLTIDGRVIPNAINNTTSIIQNDFITRNRNLAYGLITQKLSVPVGTRNELIDFAYITKDDYDWLEARNGTDIVCSLANVGGLNFTGTYNLELLTDARKSFNETFQASITLYIT